jgi:hypothetical protein
MAYLSAVQVKNMLAKKGIAKGMKLGHTKQPVRGAVTTNLGDGWVWVQFANDEAATKEKLSPSAYNSEVMFFIHFILRDMLGFEYRHEVRQNRTYDHFYRKAI